MNSVKKLPTPTPWRTSFNWRCSLHHAPRASHADAPQEQVMARTDANPPMMPYTDEYTLVEVDADYLTRAVKPKQFIHIDQSEASPARAAWIFARGSAFSF